MLTYSPKDVQRLSANFSAKVRDFDPAYRKRLEETIRGHLEGTFQDVLLMNRQGTFATMKEPVRAGSASYWTMVASNCMTGDGDSDSLSFLKFLLAGFCMLVRDIPGHPVGMPFPGGGQVQQIAGAYYCPVRTKANDVDAALCPFCPALETPEIGYLKPPVNGSERQKQEFIRNCYDYHNFNG